MLRPREGNVVYVEIVRERERKKKCATNRQHIASGVWSYCCCAVPHNEEEEDAEEEEEGRKQNTNALNMDLTYKKKTI